MSRRIKCVLKITREISFGEYRSLRENQTLSIEDENEFEHFYRVRENGNARRIVSEGEYDENKETIKQLRFRAYDAARGFLRRNPFCLPLTVKLEIPSKGKS